MIKRCLSFSFAAIMAVVMLFSACGGRVDDAPGGATPKSITVSGYTASFAQGDAFSAGGLSVTVQMSDGTTRTAAASEYTVDHSAFDGSVPGSYTIVVTLKGDFEPAIAASYTVTVGPSAPAPARESFKVLAIGNSASDDTLEYVYQIAKAYGIEDVVIGNLYIGGCSLRTHRLNASEDRPAYEYRKNTTGNFTNTPNYRISQALAEEDWDVVTLQQRTADSGQPATINADLQYMIDYVNARKTNEDARVMWHMTWAYQSDAETTDFAGYHYNQREMYDAIVEAVKFAVMTNADIDGVIPVGTAVQNARTSRLGDTLTRDGRHLSVPVGRVIGAFTYFIAITGKDTDTLKAEDLPHGCETVLDIIKECVANAIATPLAVTQSLCV